MNLKDTINEDIKSAMKSGLNDEASVLRFLNSAIKNKELEKRNRLSKEGQPLAELERLSKLVDEEVINVIFGEIKKRKESVAQYEKGGREDLAKKEAVELEILKKYVPEEMSEGELRPIVKKKIAEINGVTMKDFGKIMSSVMAEVKGRAGGELAKKIIEEELK
ncbi:MAG: GatB/YqeY domain-containing protein [Candidatus Azambacteria bacterium]|nr:GatB/YqeY domain-containing protein [Candidatus Azambacteria bacterium]